MPTPALRVSHLAVQRLRNLVRVDLELSEEQNLLIGGNGQGKTSLLEAIYLLGAIKSFRGAKPGELIQHGEREGLVRGSLVSEGPKSEVVVLLEPHGRQIRVDGKRADLTSHFHRFPMVAFHPGDLELVFGGPAVRRRFLDRMLFQAEAGYPGWFREYRRALQNRTELLRQEGQERQIRAFDRLLSEHGARLEEARHRLTASLSEATSQILEHLGVEPFQVRLRSTVEPTPEALLRALSSSLTKDRRLKRTTVGPHTDELELFRLTGTARVVASRGEARSLAIALRLGERQVVARNAAALPLLLLDDVWAELDRERVERVLSMVAAEPGQVIVTGTGASEPEAVRSWRRFEVKDGQVEEGRHCS